ncbi:MAG: hypothetical protein M3452_10675, partial [Chloroflexota bacterium]|nr:hypothetical protein [Chloroflexota bacterium]
MSVDPGDFGNLLDLAPGYGATMPNTAGAADWRGKTVETHAAMLSQLSDDSARAISQMWANAALNYETAYDNLLGYKNGLVEVWRSDAATPFLEYIDEGLRSLQQWAEASRVNERQLDRVADAIGQAQRDIIPVFESFKSETASINENEFGPGWMGDEDEDDMARMVEEKSAQSSAIMQRLSDVMMGSPIQDAPRYQGPVDARKPTQEEMERALQSAMPRPAAPGAPPGGVGGAPGAPGAPGRGAPPAAPGGPNGQTMMATMVPGMGAMGPPPVAPRGPAPGAPQQQLSQVGTSPVGPPPAAPTMPGGVPAAGAGGLGAPPAAPVMANPGSSALRGAPPAAPVMPPGMGTSGSSSALRGAPPAAPTMPGGALSGRPATVGPPPAAPNAP